MDGLQTQDARDELMTRNVGASDETENGELEETVNGVSKSLEQMKNYNMNKAVFSQLKALTSEASGNSPKKSSIPSRSETRRVSDDPDTRSQIAQWWQSRRQGSPRKYHQGLKQTGVLMNSPKSYPIAASPKKSTPPSHMSSSQTSPNPSPQKDSSRKALFRNHPGTYLESLMIVVKTVLSQPQDVALLGEADMGVITSFQSLSLPAQKLYVRLLQRKLDLKKLSKVVYDDVCAPEEMGSVVEELVDAGFFLKEEDLGDLLEFLEVLSVAEVQTLCKDMKVSAKGKKEDLMKTLIKFSKQQPSIQSFFKSSKAAPQSSSCTLLLKKAREMVGPCLKLDPEVHRVFMRVLMLYGLPSHDDMEEGGPQAALTAMLLINLGKMKFPVYTVNRTRAIFRTRDDLLKFENCCQINTELQKCVEDKKWEAALQHCKVAKDIYQELIKDSDLVQHDRSLPRFLRRFTTLSLLVYILSSSVEFLQKMRRYEAAVDQLAELLSQDTYLQDHRGLWYNRLSLNLHSHLRKPAKALEVIERGLLDPELQVAHRLTLSTRARRLARNETLAKQVASLTLEPPVELPKVVIQGRSLHGDMPGYKRAFIRQDSDRHAGEGTVTLCSVEELVIGHYQKMDYPEGLHMEGTTVRSLFGILFWDELYAPVPDAFRSPHQASPLDLLDGDFYTSRKELIDKRISDMCGWTEAEADAEVERVWEEHKEEQCLVSWQIFSSVAYVQGLVKSLGLKVLAGVFRRLASNYRHYRSGFPDLIVWNPNTKKARIVEVKGPNDTLSVKQEVWLSYLLTCGAVAEVCHVEAIGAKKMRSSPRKASPKKVSPKKTGKRANTSDDDLDEDYTYKEPKKAKKDHESDDSDSLDEDCSSPAQRKSTRRKKNDVDSDEDFVCPNPEKTVRNTRGHGRSLRPRTPSEKTARGRGRGRGRRGRK